MCMFYITLEKIKILSYRENDKFMFDGRSIRDLNNLGMVYSYSYKIYLVVVTIYFSLFINLTYYIVSECAD